MADFKFLVAIVCFATLSCNSQKTFQVAPDFLHFAIEKNLKEQRLFNPEGISPDGILLYKDSLLLIRNAPGAPTHFTLCNIREKKITGMFLPAGRQKNQSLGFLSYGIYNNKLWVDDMVKEKIICLDLNNIPVTGETKEYKMPAFYYSVQMLNDSTIIGSGDYDSDYKISLINLLSGKVINQMTPYQSDSGDPESREQKMAYESFLFLKPSGEKCISACRYADQIEIVSLNNKSSKIVKGPEGYVPDVLVATGNDGKKLSTRNQNTRYAFVKGKTTNEFIYLLYSGNNHLSEHLNYGRYLYVYDWEGKPVQKLTFADDVLDFAVTSDNKTIYAYHPGSKFIMTSNLYQDEK